MDKEKALSMLGLARRAGKLSMGHDMVINAIDKKKAKTLIFAKDVSSRLVSEVEVFVEKRNSKVEVIKSDISIDEIHHFLGYKAGVITVDDYNFSKRINELLQ